MDLKGYIFIQPEAGQYIYSGIHDQGILPPPKEGGDMALLLGCIASARCFNDSHLTMLLSEENRRVGLVKDQPSKKAKTDPEE